MVNGWLVMRGRLKRRRHADVVEAMRYNTGVVPAKAGIHTA